MAAANRSQVKIHGILSNTHRQASVSPRGCSAAWGVPRVLSQQGFPNGGTSPGPAASPPRPRDSLVETKAWEAFALPPPQSRAEGDEPWGPGTRRTPAPIPLPPLQAPGACSEPGQSRCRWARTRPPASPAGIFPRAERSSHPVSLPQRIVLSFDFPFYGHLLRQVTIATGGESGWDGVPALGWHSHGGRAGHGSGAGSNLTPRP